jgi:hypothetical protein
MLGHSGRVEGIAVKSDFIATNFTVDLVTKCPLLLHTDSHDYGSIFALFFTGHQTLSLKLKRKFVLSFN